MKQRKQMLPFGIRQQILDKMSTPKSSYKCKLCEATGVETPRMFQTKSGAEDHLESYHELCRGCQLLHPRHIGGCIKCVCGWTEVICSQCGAETATETINLSSTRPIMCAACEAP